MDNINEVSEKLLLTRINKATQMVADIDPADPDYSQKVRDITKFITDIDEDLRSHNEQSIERDRLEFEKKKAKSEERRGIVGMTLQALSLVSNLFVAVNQENGRNERFRQAVAREKEEPLLGLTERTVVQDGLRERESKGFSLPFFNKK